MQSSGSAVAVCSVSYIGYAHQGTNTTNVQNYIPNTWNGTITYWTANLGNCTVSTHYLILADGTKKNVGTITGVLSKSGGWTNSGVRNIQSGLDVAGIYVSSYGVADGSADGHNGSMTLYGIPAKWTTD